MEYKFLDNEPREVEMPAIHETFEAQVLVVTKAYTKMMYPMLVDASMYPMSGAIRVLQSGKYQVKLVQSSIANGKPTLIITEE